jgi:hypothetical protein
MRRSVAPTYTGARGFLARPSFGHAGVGAHGLSRRALCCALLSVLICTFAVAAGSARADAFTWLGPTSLISIGGNQALPTVSCPSTSQCTTVDGKGQQITFNPSTGAILTRSAVDIIGIVSSVSCPSTAQCSAVDNGGNEITFSPTTGAINQAGRANIDGHHLISVSCVSGARCSAVDDHGSEVTFDPSSGGIIGAANSIDGTVALTAVSCQPGVVAGTQQCTAVDSVGKQVTFVVAGDGSETSSSSGIDGSTALASVSCPSTTLCTAVDAGGFEVTFNPSTGVLIGSASKIDTIGMAGTGVRLTSVSCPSATVCVAVDALGNEVTFTPSATPAPSVNSVDGTTFLASVSCPAGTTSCVATDNHGNAVDFTTAGTATAHQIVAPVLVGVSCPTRAQCTIIASGSSEVTLDPTTGTINSAGIKGVDLSGNPLTAISCVSAGECTAVDSGGNEVTFDPTSGLVFANGSVSVDSSALRSVACLLTSGASPAPQCTAVDSAGNEVTFNPSTSAINNAGLSPVDLSGGTLQSVSCATGVQCTAVDSHGNEVTFNPVTGIYYGTIQAVPVDPGQNLDGVACPSAGLCTAVDRTGGIITFLNPAATPAIPTRHLIEVSNTALMAVSCPSVAQCTVVDSLGQEATFSPAASSLSPALLTPLPQANTLEAVACQSTSICFAVDAEGNGFAGIEPPVNTTLPAITGTAQEGVQLSVVQGLWTNLPTGYAYHWEDCTSATVVSTCSPISGSGAMLSTYTPTAGDIGQFIRVQETATNAGGSPTKLSAATGKVLPAVPTNTAPPAISGASVKQGQPLTEVQGTWHEDGSDPLTYTYQWKDCDASGAHCTAIAGATAPAYTPTTTDVGHTIVVAETAANTGGSGAPAASAPTAVVVLAAAPAIQGVTLAARRVQSTSSTVQGQLVTKGLTVTWRFIYWATTRHIAQTPVQSTPAGATAPVTVSQALSGLKPLTKYHFRIVEMVAAGLYAPGSTTYGNYLTFTTGSLGKMVLTRTRLSVSSSGGVTVPVVCRSSVACVGRFSLSAQTKSGRHVRTVGCAAFTRVAANRAHGVEVTLAPRCLALVQSARRHRLSATFTARPQFGETGLIEKLTLVGPRA